jgi:4-alpha-glucanotransferase
MPFYIDLDSDTVWSSPEIFHLDKNYDPISVSGVPPDYFSSTGQLWGNPLYKWETIKQTGYGWWLDRFRHMKSIVDIIRIDHFRGFESYWEIPAKQGSAATGSWRKGPGLELFRTLKKELGSLPIIAEDLGMITPEVTAFREKLGFPGMRVLQFAFDDDSNSNPHKPFNYTDNCVVYTGTHDNDTTIGWFSGNDEHSTRTTDEIKQARQRALNYTGTDGRQINIDFIRLCLSSVACTAIIPLQDVLGLDTEGRMNTPGNAEGNWEWRFTSGQLTSDKKDMLGNLSGLYGR